jgi:glycosyltransferase involved in cell wall biosynthesis
MLQTIIVITFTFLILRLLVAAYNYFTSPKLIPKQSEETGLISILIPARDEEKNIGRLLDSVLVQKDLLYEVIVLDDHSTDSTKRIVEEYARLHPEVKLLTGAPLPNGWTGKNFACHQLANAAAGKFLVFLDADVVISPELISSAVQRMKEKNLSLLSLFCQQHTSTFGEKITVPLMNYLLFTLLPIRLIESNPRPIFSAACGQFMMFKASNYLHYQWHQRACGNVTEDLAIMKMLKRNGEKGEGILSGKLMTCRMYNGFNDAVNGFSKNFITPFSNSVLLFILFLSVVLIGPLIILATANPYLIALLIAVIAVTRFFTGKLSGEKIGRIILHPFQMISLFYIGLVSIYNRCTGLGQWKGRKVAATRNLTAYQSGTVCPDQ